MGGGRVNTPETKYGRDLWNFLGLSYVHSLKRETLKFSLNRKNITHIYNKTSCFKKIKFITEDSFRKHTNITTKLN